MFIFVFFQLHDSFSLVPTNYPCTPSLFTLALYSFKTDAISFEITSKEIVEVSVDGVLTCNL